MSNPPKLGIVLNPVAGRGRAIKIENQLVDYLRLRKIIFRLEKTTGPLHATTLARQMSNEFDIIIAIGGDGTVNEVAAGLIGSTSSLAFYPIGSGNDFNRIACTPTTLNLAVDAILMGSMKIIDYGKVKIINTSGSLTEKIFINTLGIGIDAEIANEVKRINYLRGLPLYAIAALKALSTYTPNEYTIMDGITSEKEKAFLICAGNGMYEGGGFKMLPGADPTDGQLDICLIKQMPIWKSLTVIPKIIQGTHGNHKMIRLWKSKHLHISSENPFIVHGDGEIFEEQANDVSVELIPNGLSITIAHNK